MTEPRGGHSQPAPGVMTLRVYTVSRAGVISNDSGVTHVDPDKCISPTGFNGSAYPECTCPRCISKRASQRRTR